MINVLNVQTIDRFSLTSLKIDMLFQGENLASGTSFIIEDKGERYLVTNKHNLTGRNPSTRKPISATCGVPDSLRVWYCTNPALLHYASIVISLYSGCVCDAHKKWLEHNDNEVDVVLLPLAVERFNEQSLFDVSSAEKNIMVAPAMLVSIVGFPFGQTAGKQTPIWVTGAVASEPSIDIDNKPLFYVNALSRKGLSGSPVILRCFGYYYDQAGGYHIEGSIETKFLGIYSGARTISDSKDFDICMVWKPIVIDQILSSNG